jgi:hypothetical protein
MTCEGGQRLELAERLGELLRTQPASRVRILGDLGIKQEFVTPIGGMSGQPRQDVVQLANGSTS